MRTAVLVMLAMLAACKGDREKCEKAARNYFELRYWAHANDEIDKLPPADRDLARKKKQSEYINKVEEQIDFRTEQCVSANNDKQVDCMIAAKTEKEVLKCADPAESTN
jgi:hypothetical protein